MTKERWLALLQIVFVAVLIIMPACSGDTDCSSSCGDCGDCNIDECEVDVDIILDCEEICEVELRVTLPEGFCKFSSDITLKEKNGSVVNYSDSGTPVAHTVDGGVATRTIELDNCVGLDATPKELMDNYDFSIAGSGCLTTGCPPEEGKIMTLAASTTLMYNVEVEDCKLVWNVELTESDFSTAFPDCVKCCD